VPTLGEMKASGEGLIFYCKPNGGQACHHTWTPSIDQLIQYFGVDFEVVANREAFLARFVCEKCGRRSADIGLVLSSDTPGLNGGQGGHNHQPPMTLEESVEEHRARTAERKRLGIKTIEEQAAEWRAARKAEAKAAKPGSTFIGPPNPWARRKRGRWL
jgi:hypothetical protein